MDDFGDQGLRLWIESIPDALVLVDGRGAILEANAALTSLFGYREEELVGQLVEMLVPERVREAHVQRRRVREDDPTDRPMGSDLQIIALRKDGSEFEVDIELCTRRMPGGLVTVAVVRDLSDVSGLAELEASIVRLRDGLAERLDQLVEAGAMIADVFALCAEADRALEMVRRIRDDDPDDSEATDPEPSDPDRSGSDPSGSDPSGSDRKGSGPDE